MNLAAFTPGTTASISVTSNSSSVAISGTGQSLEIQNDSTVTCFVKLGSSNVAATTAGYPVLGGQSKVITRNPYADTHIAAITASGTATLYITNGEGV